MQPGAVEWDETAFANRLERELEAFRKEFDEERLLSARRTHGLAFDITVLLESCQSRFPKKVKAVRRAIRSAKDGCEPLWDSISSLQGEFLVIKEHIRGAAGTLNRLQDLARALPPLRDLTDEQMQDKIIKKAYAVLQDGWESGAKKYEQRKRAQAARSRKAKSRQKKGKKTAAKTKTGKKGQRRA
jgi:hypothetical protein